MRILAIESSCDETALALISKEGDQIVVEKKLLASQVKTHAIYGGVVPEIAAREHAELVFALLAESGLKYDGSEVEVIAVTSGPGLIPALRVGVEFGKTLAWAWNKPLVAVNHLEGHVYSVWLNAQNPPKFPAVCLLVSGGHTELILMKNHGVYELIGMTRDDAAGEAFDKVAKLLNLGYPGGPEISRVAEHGNPEAIHFPRPMIDSPDFDFSFSGLKTAVRNYVAECVTPLLPEQLPGLPGRGSGGGRVEDIAASFQTAVVDTLVTKTLRAVQTFHPASVILAGGVSANRLLRSTLQQALIETHPDVTFHAPDLSLTGDNAVMIAVAGAFRAEQKEFVDPLTLVADANMRLA